MAAERVYEVTWRSWCEECCPMHSHCLSHTKDVVASSEDEARRIFEDWVEGDGVFVEAVAID